MRYQTEQKEKLSAYLSANASRQFTIEEIAEALSPDIGRSTVYRLIRSLLDDGLVRRLSTGVGRGVAYQYLPSEPCRNHLHLKCLACGKMTHLDCSISTFLDRQILATNRFVLDDRLTILYGRCEACADSGEGVRNG